MLIHDSLEPIYLLVVSCTGDEGKPLREVGVQHGESYERHFPDKDFLQMQVKMPTQPMLALHEVRSLSEQEDQ